MLTHRWELELLHLCREPLRTVNGSYCAFCCHTAGHARYVRKASTEHNSTVNAAPSASGLSVPLPVALGPSSSAPVFSPFTRVGFGLALLSLLTSPQATSLGLSALPSSGRLSLHRCPRLWALYPGSCGLCFFPLPGRLCGLNPVSSSTLTSFSPMSTTLG